MSKFAIISVIFLVLTWEISYSQKYHTSSNRALTAYTNGKQQYEFLYYNNAEKFLKDAVAIDPGFYEAHLLLGEMYSDLKRYSLSSQYYGNAVRIDSLYNKSVFYNLANAEMMSGNYEKALLHFRVFLELGQGPEKNRQLAEKNIVNCEFAAEAVKSPVPYNPVNLGDSVNTTDDEYWPSLTADGQVLMFTRQTRSRANTRNQEDFYISKSNGKRWLIAQNAGWPLNTSQNEGAQSLSADGRYMYFTACDRLDGAGRCDIYYSSTDGNVWSEAVNLGSPVNTAYWEAQPSVSANGMMLFFTSNRPGGIGGMDLWFSVKNKNGKWGVPRNMGDIINTYNDEMGLIIDARGETGFFSTKRDEKRGKDIFYFSLYEGARPDPVSYVKGLVTDGETGMLLQAEYELVDLGTGTVKASGSSDTRGSLLVCLPAGYNYGFNVNKTGYLFYSDNFMLEGTHSASSPFNKKVVLHPLKAGRTLQLSNIFYDTDSWEIKKESKPELEMLQKLLSENRNLFVEVGGYTDSTGTEAYNIVLSEKRALSVLNYLVSRGIDRDRLSYKGYGAASPVGDNVTDEGRRMNRRTEVRIIKISDK